MTASVRTRQISQQCLGVRIRLLARMLTGIYDSALRPFGVRINQVNILVVVATQGPLPAHEVSALLELDKSTLSRDLQSILASGWLQAVPARDRRSRHLQVTPAGHTLLDRIYPAWQAAQAEATARLGPVATVAIRETVNSYWAKRSLNPQ